MFGQSLHLCPPNPTVIQSVQRWESSHICGCPPLAEGNYLLLLCQIVSSGGLLGLHSTAAWEIKQLQFVALVFTRLAVDTRWKNNVLIK